MEKADILEMTVKHLRSLQRQVAIQTQATSSPSHSHTTKSSPTAPSYKSGYSECAEEVRRYLGSTNFVNHEVKSQLTSHLSTRISSGNGFEQSRDVHLRECSSLSPSPRSSPVSSAAHSPVSSRDSFSPVSNSSAQSSPIMCSNSTGSSSQFSYTANSQPMLLAAGSVSPLLSTTQGFVPIVISPVAATQTQLTSQQNTMTSSHVHPMAVTSQTHISSPQTSPMPGTVIPLYQATAQNQVSPAAANRSNAHYRQSSVKTHDNVLHLKDITQNAQDTYHQTRVCYFSSEQKAVDSEPVWRPW